jgi:hypothetical protein
MMIGRWEKGVSMKEGSQSPIPLDVYCWVSFG